MHSLFASKSAEEVAAADDLEDEVPEVMEWMVEDGGDAPSPAHPQYVNIRITLTGLTGKELKAIAVSLGLGGSGAKASLVKKIRKSGHPDVTPHDDPNSFTLSRAKAGKDSLPK